MVVRLQKLKNNSRIEKYFLQAPRPDHHTIFKIVSWCLYQSEERLRTAEKVVLCEKWLNNAQGRGICKAKAGYDPWGMVY